jgi:hypothetical protein
MPPQNPITRIEQVAIDLKRLADETEQYLGPEAKAALLNWHRELLVAAEELVGSRGSR